MRTAVDNKHNWMRTAVVAAAVFVLGVVGWEVTFVRLGGEHQPIVDSAERWSEWRERAALAGSDAIILVGASRMQLDVDLATVARQTQRPVFQLAIDGTSFLPVLLDLALDPRVNGTVIVSVRPPDLAGGGTERAQETVNYYRYWQQSAFRSPSEYAERKLTRFVYRFVPSREQGIRPETLLKLWFADRRIENYLVTFSSREREADYSKVNIRALREARLARSIAWYRKTSAVEEEQFARTLRLLQEAVQRIRGRGGDVIFVRFPVSPQLLAASEQFLPHTRTLDRLPAATGAVLIDFADYPKLREFELPDGSHLDRGDQQEFTQRLVDILLQDGGLQHADLR